MAQGNAYYCNDEYGVLFNKSKTKLIQAPVAGMQGAYSVPDGVTTIGDSAFYHCTSLTELTFPDGLTRIEDNGCYYTGVAEVVIPATVTTIGESGFGFNANLKNIYFCGDAPAFGINIFMRAHANVYYHEGTKGWPAQIKDMYDTQLLWKKAHIYADGEYCVVCGEPSSTATGLVKLNDGWYYYQNGVSSQTTGLVNYNNEWWYVVNGKVASDTTTLVKYNGGWYYVNKGSVDWGYTVSFVFNGGTYRIVKGRVA